MSLEPGREQRKRSEYLVPAYQGAAGQQAWGRKMVAMLLPLWSCTFLSLAVSRAVRMPAARAEAE